MGKKYKIDYEDDERGLYDLLADAVAAGVIVDPIDLNDYVDDDQRISVFNGAGETLRRVFNKSGQHVTVHKDTDTIGGEITVCIRDMSLSNDELCDFYRAICSANSVEFTSFTDGHTEIGLIYRDLEVRRSDYYAN